ncbi:hypothetical protein [Pseudomonas syringae]|uniref:hypothetical protein n=1 Tax=Pseudomonas syringae TaxID=317 RepID=UPI001F0D9FB4|nr:hypothetical protein [Pseudomonas syringae]MCH5536277.1 hypothetical protein [Pseudomonas syringae pv. syringae]MCH5572846.1 hypothetical protein [Pseudomonas syringae pv. syringae]
MTRSVTQGIPTLEREERSVSTVPKPFRYRTHALRGYADPDALRPALSARRGAES